jgi:hypothetical protein
MGGTCRGQGAKENEPKGEEEGWLMSSCTI